MKRKIEIVFCILFLLMVAVPLALSDFRGGGVSQYERRQLKEFPAVVTETGLDLRKLSEIDDWIDDNIGLRDFCVNLYTQLMVKGLNVSSSDKVMFGTDGWYFYTPDHNIEIGLGNYFLTDEQLDKIAQNQQRISDFYHDMGVEYTLVLTPSKASVYTEYVAGEETTGGTIIDQVSDYLTEHTDVHVVNTKTDLVGAKDQGKLFWKTDTHWTELGSYVAYGSILDQFKAWDIVSTPPIYVDFTKETARGFGEFNTMLGNYKILGEEEVPKGVMQGSSEQITSGKQYEKLAAIQKAIEPNYPAVIIHNDQSTDKNLLIYGDSQWELSRNMPWYFSANFSNVVSMRSDKLNVDIDYCAQPDVIIFGCSERYIDTKLLADVPSFIPVIDQPDQEVRDKSGVNDAEWRLFVDSFDGAVSTQEDTLNLMSSNTSSSVNIQGWCADLQNHSGMSSLYVQIGTMLFPCEYGLNSEGVADYYQDEAYSQCGFSVQIPRICFEEINLDQIKFVAISEDGQKEFEKIYALRQTDPSTMYKDLADLPVQPLENSANNLWIDYCNDVAQPDAQLVHLDLSQSDELSFSGWAADLAEGTPLGALYVQIGDQIFQCHYGEERGAVADYFQNENLKYTGFSFSIPADVFQGGAVDTMIFIEVSQDGSYRYEDVPYQIDYAQNSGAEGTGDPQTIPQQPGDSAQSGGNENLFASKYVTILLLAVVILTFCLLLFLLVHNDQGEMLRKFNQKKFLFSELIKRDFTLKYKRTILGMFWSILFPLVNLLIMWLVFNKLLGSNIDHFVVYLFAGQLIFNYFSDATNMGMTSLVDNASIFTKVNVPKYLFLFSRNVSTLINFGLTLMIFFLFVGLDGIPFSVKFLSLLYPIICLIILNLGTGMILSALYMFFRDMRYLWSVATQLLMWMSAIFYSIDGFSEEMQRLFLLNPVYLCIRYFRKVVIEDAIPTAQFHLLLAAISLGIFAVGCIVYKKKNHEFLYYV